MSRTATSYLGIPLKNPVVASASPLSKSLEAMKRAEDAGAGAIVMFSLFEEQIVHESQSLAHYLDYGSESFAEATSYLPEASEYTFTSDEYLALLSAAKEQLSIPIIGSINGISPGGWAAYARLMQDAGADAVELNIYHLATNPDILASDVEERYLEVVRGVCDQVKVPVAVKIGPYFSSMGNMARRLVDAGARGLVLFNRFYLPDFDVEELKVRPAINLSQSHEMRLPLHWTALLFGRVVSDFAITTGVHTGADVVKAILAGANVAMTASAVLRQGPGAITGMVQGLERWMDDHEVESLFKVRGAMSQLRSSDPEAFTRQNYMRELQSYSVDPAFLGA